MRSESHVNVIVGVFTGFDGILIDIRVESYANKSCLLPYEQNRMSIATRTDQRRLASGTQMGQRQPIIGLQAGRG